MKSNEKEINSILLANSFLIKCKFDSSSNEDVELARKYLTQKIKSLLNIRTNVSVVESQLID